MFFEYIKTIKSVQQNTVPDDIWEKICEIAKEEVPVSEIDIFKKKIDEDASDVNSEYHCLYKIAEKNMTYSDCLEDDNLDDTLSSYLWKYIKEIDITKRDKIKMEYGFTKLQIEHHKYYTEGCGETEDVYNEEFYCDVKWYDKNLTEMALKSSIVKFDY